MEKDKCDFCKRFTYCVKIAGSELVICAFCTYPKEMVLVIKL